MVSAIQDTTTTTTMPQDGGGSNLARSRNDAACAGAEVGDASFLGFGFDPSNDEWGEDGAGGREEGKAGACDLGWGGLDANTDIASSRERGTEREEEEEEEEGYAFDAEGR